MSSPTSLPLQSGSSPVAGSVPEFKRVYAEHFAFVWRCLRGLGVGPEQLDDAAQEVFIVVHRRLPEFRAGMGIRGWLFGILRLIARNQQRGVVRRLHAAARLAREPVARPPDPFDLVLLGEAGQLLLGFLETLEDNRREVFFLVEIEGLPITEVAHTLTIPVNTAYSRLRRARTEFAAWITNREAPP